MAKAEEKSLLDSYKEMRERGIEQVLPMTERKVRIRTVECATVLRSGNFPDILTPLVIKGVYQELTDDMIVKFLETEREGVEESIKFLDAVDFIVQSSIADDTKVSDLTSSERRWVFRLAMGPAELLITFRYESEDDVELVAESQELQPTTE